MDLLNFLTTRKKIYIQFYSLLKETLTPLNTVNDNYKWYILNKMRIESIELDYDDSNLVLFKLEHDGSEVVCRTDLNLTKMVYIAGEHYIYLDIR